MNNYDDFYNNLGEFKYVRYKLRNRWDYRCGDMGIDAYDNLREDYVYEWDDSPVIDCTSEKLREEFVNELNREWGAYTDSLYYFLISTGLNPKSPN